MLATTYPLLDVFLTLLVVAGFVIWFVLVVLVIVDLFRSHDLTGAAKAAWFIIVLVLPLVGVVLYLWVRGSSMRGRGSGGPRPAV
jgi:tellurite resistance protein TehA-like permease